MTPEEEKKPESEVDEYSGSRSPRFSKSSRDDGIPQIMKTNATPKPSRSPTPNAVASTHVTATHTEQKLLIVSNNSVGTSISASSELIDQNQLLSPMPNVGLIQ